MSLKILFRNESISCPICGTRHDLKKSQSCVTVSEQTIQDMWRRGVKFVNKVFMTTMEFPKGSLKNICETKIDPMNRKSSIFNKSEHNLSTMKQKHHMQGIY